MKNVNTDKSIRLLVFCIFELFTLFSVVFFIVRWNGFERILLCIVTIFLLLLPTAAEHYLRIRLSLPFYLICMCYAIGAMLGHSWKFYYLFPGWDKLLHITGGVVFALLGAYLPRIIMGRDLNHPFMTALFALCFSIALSAVWEFFEYGMDRFFAMDMQNDTVVHSIHSYLLGDELGVLGSIEQIQDVTIHGQELGLGGYLDLGLIDSMNDMLLESLGALIYVLFYLFSNGKLHAIQVLAPKEKDSINTEVKKQISDCSE